tara:strand:+ start:1187 stop:1939 length:753 start_codon:yes stop_codon:yes gene_type:complete
MNGIMLHCGAEAITRDELAALPVAQPKGSRHAIRPFIEDANMIEQLLADVGMPVSAESYGITKDEDGVPKQFFGLLEVEEGDGRDHGVMVGVRGSYDQTLSRGIAIGSRVFVCDNLCFSGEIEMKTKQTLDIDSRIYGLLKEAINEAPYMVEKQDGRFKRYRDAVIGQIAGDSLLTDMVRKGVLNASQIGRALKEWDKPSHEEHAEDGWSLWRLHNAVTEALKPTNPNANALRLNWDRTIGMTNLLDGAV